MPRRPPNRPLPKLSVKPRKSKANSSHSTRTAQKEIEGYKATAARIEPVLKEYLDTLTKEWPKSILDKCPADAGYEARLAWYEGNKDVAAEFLAMKGSGDGKKPPEKPNPYVNGNGATPPPSGSQANDKDAVASQAPLYRTL
jgi:hypothetical protein